MKIIIYKKELNAVCIKTIIIILILLVCALVITNILISRYNYSDSNKKVSKELVIVSSELVAGNIETTKKIKINKLEELQKTNPEIVAILEIEGTNINYPVVQGADNSYYMTHNYRKEKSKDGALFLDKDYNFNKPSDNFLVYGHNNIGSSQMFAGLINYKKEAYYKKHKIISLTTNVEEAKYEIISVFLSRVYYKNEQDVFRYYYFIDSRNKEEYENFVKCAKAASLYNIESTANYKDKLMTLSTCEYSQKNGRLAIVARKIETK